MAKNLLIIAAIAAAATAMPSTAAATEVQEIRSVKGNLDVLPEKATNDLAAKLVAHDTDYKTGVMTVHIYDENLNVVKEFTTPAQPRLTATYTQETLWSDDWSASERTEEATAYPFGFYYYTSDGTEVQAEVMQKPFTGGAAYIYPIPEYEITNVNWEYDTDNDGVIDQKEHGRRIIETGMKLMADNGSNIATIKYPAGYGNSAFSKSPLEIYNLNGKWILAVDVTKLGTHEYYNYIILYSVDETGGVKQVGAPVRAGVAPTTPRQGTPVNISLPENTDSAEIVLTSVSGKVVSAMKVEAGRTDAAIDTSALTQGLYVVSVKTADKTKENTKIIVR